MRVVRLGRRRANRRQHIASPWTLHRHTSQRRADILQRDIVGDDVFIQVRQDALASLRFGVQQEAVLETQQIDIGLDMTLRLQKKGVASRTRRKL